MSVVLKVHHMYKLNSKLNQALINKFIKIRLLYHHENKIFIYLLVSFHFYLFVHSVNFSNIKSELRIMLLLSFQKIPIKILKQADNNL